MKNTFAFITTIAWMLVGCGQQQPADPIPEHQTFNVQSKHLDELRTINVWTPVSYKAHADSLPVLYMADGGIREDFPHIANTLEKLIKENKIGPVILVGIENTQRRRDLTGFTKVKKDKKVAPVVGGSTKFRDFIRDELFPEVDKRYRTTNSRSIIGESLSGLFVMETFFTAPDMFDRYIAFDPSLWWNDQYLVRNAKHWLTKLPADEKRLWFAGSDARDIYPHTQKLAGTLKQENIPNLTWHYADEPGEQHGTIFRAAKEKAIIWTLGDK